MNRLQLHGGRNKSRITEVVQRIVDCVVRESRFKAFRSEYQIQGYMTCYLRFEQDRVGHEFEREAPTSIRYSRNQSGLLTKSAKGRRGSIDFIIECDDGLVGIEIEYPRGKGTSPERFSNHLRNDCVKLNNEELQERIVLVFLYRDPPLSSREIVEIVKEYPGTRLACLRLRRQDEFESETDSSVVKSFVHPVGWLTT